MCDNDLEVTPPSWGRYKSPGNAHKIEDSVLKMKTAMVIAGTAKYISM
jgi:hypothetical protein